MTISYRHTILVRYGDCDMQRVVFNANYLAYVDDAVDSWMRSTFASQLAASGDPTNLHSIGFDFMVKKASIIWTAPVMFAEKIDLDCEVSRWGNTSFDVDVRGSVEDQERFTCVVTYVSVDPANQRPVPVPDMVKESLGFKNPS